MTETQTMRDAPNPSPFRLWGLWAIAAGAIAVVLVCIQIFGPPAEPQPSAAQQIGEIAGEMKRSAWRAFLGMEPEPPAPQPDPSLVSQYLPIAGPVLGVLAIVLAVVSALMRENWRLATYGTVLGASAVLMQMFWWVALLIAGVILLAAVIENLGGFFSFLPWE